jgi:hypothetical protein
VKESEVDPALLLTLRGLMDIVRQTRPENEQAE